MRAAVRSIPVLQYEACPALSHAAESLASTSGEQLVGLCTTFVRSFAKGKGKGGPPKKKTSLKLSSGPEGPVNARKHALAVIQQKEQAEKKLDSLTEQERALYSAIAGVPADRSKLSTQKLLQKVALPWTEEDVAALMHQNLSNQAGVGVHITPLEFRNMFQSAAVVADYVADMLMSDMNWGKVQRLFTQLLGHGESTFVRGLKIQIKGRLSVKAGKAASKEWQYGDTSMATISDAVDYSEKTALTRAGYIGVKVWLRYHKSAFPHLLDAQSARVSVDELLEVPRTLLPSRSISAWWNRPGPLQPFTNQTWQALPAGAPGSAPADT